MSFVAPALRPAWVANATIATKATNNSVSFFCIVFLFFVSNKKRMCLISYH